MPPGWLPSGTVTFLFTDIEGSTKLWEDHPDAMRTSLARHDFLVREAVAASNGYVFKTVGDAFCVAFATAADAIRAMLNAQQALSAEPWPAETPIQVRMALHTGAVESRDDDYFGPPVNRVARLLNAAHGGQCLLSLATYELARDYLPTGVSLLDLGTHQLKDLARAEQVFQLCHPALQTEFPTIRSLSNQPNNLPLQLTNFIGRGEEMQRIRQHLESCRLVTLFGSGGSGKTRLSLQIGAELLDTFPSGVWLVELAAVQDPNQVASAIADALGIQESRSQNLTDDLIKQIGAKRMLIVLDNCEHLIGSCATIADLLLRSCSGLKMIATSREALGIPGEVTFHVPPLSTPDLSVRQTPESLSQFAAVRLFIDRAIQALPSFTVTNENAPAVASVCCRLDGIPLAIELAAARIRSLSVDQIEARLGQRFSLLTGGSRVALPRQQTLRAMIDWSYDLLTDQEKAIIQRLSVFSGGCDLEAAEDVCSDENIPAGQVSDSLFALVDKSLVVAQEHGLARRYVLLESVRDYACERLTESGQASFYRDRHLDYFRRLSRTAATHLTGPEQKQWVDRLDQDLDNFVAAFGHGLNKEAGLEMAGNIWWFWFFRGHFSRGRATLTAALTQNPDAAPEIRLRALHGAGNLADQQGDSAVALAIFHECVELSQKIGDRNGYAASCNYVGNVYGNQGDFVSAEPHWKRAHEIWTQLEAEGNPAAIRGLAAATDNLGNLASNQGQFQLARDYYQQGYELRLKAGNAGFAAYSLLNLGLAEFKLGNRRAALAHYQKGLSISRDLKDVIGIGNFLMGLAELAEPTVAIQLLGRFSQLREDIEISLNEEERIAHEQLIEELRRSLGPTEFESAWSEARAMDLYQVVQQALQIQLP